MPFADEEKRTEHFAEHGAELRTKSNEVFAAVLRILLKLKTSSDWNEKNYEKLGEYIVDNGTPFQGTSQGKFVYVSEKKEDGVIIAGYRKSKGETVLTTVFYADNIESKFVKKYFGEK